ncbi:hypothetical protein Q5H93_13015 [Hymenobacter sp. ASUV-10]|uniref:Lipoprotein n=1 Tax=Hymenobacter aranciens TaxID=3063996 RepID=A0ABT9BBN5_9BACT|nr:hypothetical protein [Hymenobacter sp. ASUV-10]MDO7875658.1 hypothetical protein [Hymenobacter sp. ASUV-10]
MRKHFPALLGLAATTLPFTACNDAQPLPTPSSIVPLIRATVAADADTFDYRRAVASINNLALEPNPSRPVCRFTITRNYVGDDIIIRKVYVYKSLRRGSVPAAYQYSSRALAREVTQLPATLSFDSQDALTGIYRITLPSTGTSTDSLTAGPRSGWRSFIPPNSGNHNSIFSIDAIIFTFEYDVEINGQTQHVALDPTHQVTLEYPSTRLLEVFDGTPIGAPYSVTVPFVNL